MKVAIGGTFDPLHDGHKELLKRALQLAEDDENSVVVGLTSDEMACKRHRTVLSYNVRKANLMQYIEREFNRDVKIFKIDDSYGATLTEDFDYIVVSPETYPVAEEINNKRVEADMKPIEISRVECVLAEDGGSISSTRIKKGEIDKHGRLIRSKEA